jgi:class 3 adenylate cyclase/tetratricopeptide (TPR) repeat protein
VASTMPIERRKLATLLFCDLVGSTEFGERVDPEAVRDVMSEYFSRLGGAIERHGGTVEKFIGDAVVAVFGVPAAREDDALRALRAAWDMQAQVSELAKEVEEAFGVGFAVRIGVNSGTVVANVAGGDQALVTGDAVNTAARLEQAAAPGTILMGSSTWQLVRGVVTTERVQPVVAKGKSAPVTAYRLVALAPDVSGRTQGEARRLVGRDEELRALLGAFEGCVQERRPRFAAVLGDPGIGKSRLVSEFLLAIAASATVIRGRCLSYGDGVTYWALAEAVRGLLSGHDDESRDQMVTKLNAVAPDEPQAVAHVARAIGLADGASSSLEITWGVRRLFEYLAARTPLVVVIDDAHWAEPALIELLLDVHETVTGAPVFIIVVARPQLLERRPDLPEVLMLKPLSVGAMSELLDSVLGRRPIAPVRSRLLDHAAGNPLFIEELAGMLLEAGAVVRAGPAPDVLDEAAEELSIPLTLEALLDSRLDALPEEERLPLECASVEGQLFHQGGVATLLSDSGVTVEQSLARLTERNLVRPAVSVFLDDVAFSFRHLLIREAAYRSAPKKVRAAWHVRLADWLVEKVGGRLGEFQEILGYHLEHAHQLRTQLGLLDQETLVVGRKGAAHLSSAANRARERGDIRAALILVGRAEELLRPDDPALPPILVELGVFRREGGDLVGAMRTLERASSLADEAGLAAVGAHARVEHAFIRLDAEPGSDEVARRDMVEATEVLRRVGDEARLARALQRLATAELFWGLVVLGEQHLAEASVVVERLGDRSMASRIAWSYASFADFGPSSTSEGLARVEAALQESAEYPRLSAELLLLRAIYLAQRGASTEATETAARAERSLAELGEDEFTSQMVGETRYRMAQLAEDNAAEERALRQLYSELKMRNNLGHLASIGYRLGDVLRRGGRHSEARPFIDESRALGDPEDIDVQVGWRVALGRIRALEGKGEDAVKVVSDAVEMAERTDYVLHLADAKLALAEVKREVGDTVGAVSACQAAQALYMRKGCVVMADRASGLLAELNRG